jgi:hypothetical protein
MIFPFLSPFERAACTVMTIVKPDVDPPCLKCPSDLLYKATNMHFIYKATNIFPIIQYEGLSHVCHCVAASDGQLRNFAWRPRGAYN